MKMMTNMQMRDAFQPGDGEAFDASKVDCLYCGFVAVGKVCSECGHKRPAPWDWMDEL